MLKLWVTCFSFHTQGVGWPATSLGRPEWRDWQVCARHPAEGATQVWACRGTASWAPVTRQSPSIHVVWCALQGGTQTTQRSVCPFIVTLDEKSNLFLGPNFIKFVNILLAWLFKQQVKMFGYPFFGDPLSIGVISLIIKINKICK